jgi:hypothetical protein
MAAWFTVSRTGNAHDPLGYAYPSQPVERDVRRCCANATSLLETGDSLNATPTAA